LCSVIKIKKGKVTANVLQQIETPEESPLRIHLFQAFVKEKAFDFILQKSTELGVASIHILETKFSQKLPQAKLIEKKIQRWEKIAWEACKQSGRVKPPEIHIHKDWQNIPFEEYSYPIYCLHTKKTEEAVVWDTLDSNDVGLVIGPEGGFSENEVSDELKMVHLGKRILRADTASITGVSILQFLFGDLKHF
ncbi:MAG: 16S rRNA (uracil1498-N3)-methyltransferase, partial [bacterium]